MEKKSVRLWKSPWRTRSPSTRRPFSVRLHVRMSMPFSPKRLSRTINGDKKETTKLTRFWRIRISAWSDSGATIVIYFHAFIGSPAQCGAGTQRPCICQLGDADISIEINYRRYNGRLEKINRWTPIYSAVRLERFCTQHIRSVVGGRCAIQHFRLEIFPARNIEIKFNLWLCVLRFCINYSIRIASTIRCPHSTHTHTRTHTPMRRLEALMGLQRLHTHTHACTLSVFHPSIPSISTIQPSLLPKQTSLFFGVFCAGWLKWGEREMHTILRRYEIC